MNQTEVEDRLELVHTLLDKRLREFEHTKQNAIEFENKPCAQTCGAAIRLILDIREMLTFKPSTFSGKESSSPVPNKKVNNVE